MQTLAELLAAHPEWAGLSSGEVADLINKLIVDELVTDSWVNARTLASMVGPLATGEVIHQLRQAHAKLPAGGQKEAFGLILDWITHPASRGIDVGDLATRAAIDQMVSDQLISAEIATAIKARGVRAAPWPYANGFGRLVDFADIEKARS